MLWVASGCQGESRRVGQAPPDVRVVPMLGGMGGFMVQVSSADSDLISVYHAPIQAFDRSEPSRQSIPFRLLFQLNANDAGAEVLPARVPPRPTAPLNGEPRAGAGEESVERIAAEQNESPAPDEPARLPPAAGADLAETMISTFAAAVEGHEPEPMLRIDSVYAFDPNEIPIEDAYVEAIRLVESPRGELSGSVTLHNTTEQRWRPGVSFLVVNRYGITLAQARMSWTLASIVPGERRLQSLRFTPIEQANIFQLLGEDIAEDFDKPFALVVKYPD